MASCHAALHPKRPQQLPPEWLPPHSAIQHHGTLVPLPILFNMAPCYVAPRPERPQQSPSEHQQLHPVMPYHGTPASPSIPATMVLCHVALHSERPQQLLLGWLTTVLYHTTSRHAGTTINPRHHGIMPCCTARRALTATVARVVHYCALPCNRHYGTPVSPPIPVNIASCYAARRPGCSQQLPPEWLPHHFGRVVQGLLGDRGRGTGIGISSSCSVLGLTRMLGISRFHLVGFV